MSPEQEQNLTLSPTLYFIFSKNFLIEIKNSLKTKTPVIRPSFVKVPLLIQGSSEVTEVVVEEDPPSSVLLILFYLLW